MSTPLEVTNLSAGYGEVMILSDVSITVRDKEIVCVAGPNGAGKSTLLKALSGILPWRTGTVLIHGAAAANGQTQDAARSFLSYVPQVANVFPSLTVQENLSVAGQHIANRSPDALAATFERFPALADSRRRLAGSLSGGQRQALAFAMALVRRPRVLLLDEPTAALSPQAAREVIERVCQLRDTGIAVLLVEQNVNLALEVADRAYILDSGRNAIDGPAASIKEDPDIRRVYLGGHVAQ